MTTAQEILDQIKKKRGVSSSTAVPTMGKPSEKSNPLMEFIKGLNAPTSRSSTFQEKVMQAITFGGIDNLVSAGTAAVKAPFSDKTFGEVYKEDQATSQARTAAQDEAHPIVGGAGSVVGSLIGPDPTKKLQAASKAGQVGKSILSGAVNTSLQAFGEADEAGIIGRLKAAADGFVTGGIVGAGFGTAGAAVSRVADSRANAKLQKSFADMRKATNDAYKAVETSGEIIPGTILTQNMNDAATKIRKSYFYDPTSDAAKPIEKALDKIDDRIRVTTTAGDKKPVDMTLGELEEMRKGAWKAYNQNKNKDMITIIKAIDQTMDDAAAVGSPLMKAARQESRMEQNTKMFDKIMKTAERKGTSGTGDYASRFKYAAENILDSEKYSKFLNDEEAAALQAIIDGTTTGNVTRFIGRFAPNSGNMASLIGMMTAYHNPVLGIPAMITAHTAKKASNVSTMHQVEEARRILSGSPAAIPTAQLGPTAAKAVGQTVGPDMPSLLDMTGLTQTNTDAGRTLMQIQNMRLQQQGQQ